MRIEQLNHTELYGYIYDALGRRIEKHRLDRDGKPCNRHHLPVRRATDDSGKQRRQKAEPVSVYR
ncbi:hypothetical protein [Snodgrassella alvi]|uniref:hypothetical protein n=1 Tax=Snodgrassella alvi TaxID=1196083 RepID=UPI0012FDF68C|nr:hypothetical protein [Snodgrassella alvi]